MATADKSPVEIANLTLTQLQQVGNAVEEDIQVLSTSMQQLKKVQHKLVESKESLSRLKPETLGQQMLVPLTSSMYVPGFLDRVDKVIVEIGAGYYVEKVVSDADEYFDRRIKFVTEQMQKLQPLLQEKVKAKQSIMGEIQKKVQQIISAQEKSGKGIKT